VPWWLGACVNGKGLGFALVFEDWTVCTVARPIGLLRSIVANC
jgi:hypothetical protein